MMKEISTVKRKANVGERILITNKSEHESRYVNGDILEVTRDGAADYIYSEGILIFTEEYEVIIENEEAGGMEKGIIEKMQAELARTKGELNELKTKVAALEEVGPPRGFTELDEMDFAMEPVPKRTFSLPVKTPQQIRDEIVAKAKADVASRYNPRGRIANKWGDYRDVEFIVNKEKRTVVVLLRGYISGRVYEKGIAKADPSDCFNVHLGKAIAIRRALGLEVPAEYYSAPAPTEVRVGDVVSYRSGRVATVREGNLSRKYNETILYTARKEGTIIDDSRES